MSEVSVPSPRIMCCLVASVTLLAACAPETQEEFALDDALGSLGQPIQGGYVDDGDKNVVGILYDGGYEQAMCTGSLIAANVVLTAQHCVAPVLHEVGGGVQCGVTTFGAPYPAGDLYVHTETVFPYNVNQYVRATEVSIPPGGDAFCGRDLAIIILSEPIDPAVAYPLTPRVDVALARGEIYSAVGYGQTSDGATNSAGTRHRRDGLTVNCVGEECPSYATTPSEWVGETGICSGDSGGPALDSVGRVCGVTSRGAMYCETPIYGHPANWADWIRERTAYGASLLGVEPAPWTTGWPTDPAYSYPVGPPCEVVENCSSGICLDGYCSRLCSDAAPCPEGFECTADTAVCKALPPPAPKKKSSSTEQSSCSIGRAGATDPTQPTPWLLAMMALGGAAALRRRRGR